MTNHSQWNDFLGSLLSNAIGRYKETTEYEYIRKQEEEIDMILRDHLTPDQKELVEECIFDLGLVADHESEMVYKQGLRDCVWMLKNLGVLASV